MQGGVEASTQGSAVAAACDEPFTRTVYPLIFRPLRGLGLGHFQNGRKTNKFEKCDGIFIYFLFLFFFFFTNGTIFNSYVDGNKISAI